MDIRRILKQMGIPCEKWEKQKISRTISNWDVSSTIIGYSYTQLGCCVEKHEKDPA